jgi:hypothetical protein
MAYAGDIITDSFNRTKELFFPIRKEYWLKMGFVNLFAGNSGYGGNSGSSSSGRNSELNNIDLKQAISQFNSEALKFLAQYGYIVGIGIFLLYLISLLFTYISSVLTFVFMDGLVNKEIKVRKSFIENKLLGSQLFFLRLVLGIISMAAFVIIMLPLISAFFSGTLAQFNFWLLIPMIIGFVLFCIIIGIFLFFVNDFVVPIMYLKKYPFKSAWDHFITISKNNKLEIFLYWLIKLGLSIGSGIISLLVMLILLIPIFLVALPFVALGFLAYFASKAIGSDVFWIAVAVILAVIFICLMIYSLAVIFVPVSAFFTIFSIEMVKKLELGGKKETVQESKQEERGILQNPEEKNPAQEKKPEDFVQKEIKKPEPVAHERVTKKKAARKK